MTTAIIVVLFILAIHWKDCMQWICAIQGNTCPKWAESKVYNLGLRVSPSCYGLTLSETENREWGNSHFARKKIILHHGLIKYMVGVLLFPPNFFGTVIIMIILLMMAIAAFGKMVMLPLVMAGAAMLFAKKKILK